MTDEVLRGTVVSLLDACIVLVFLIGELLSNADIGHVIMFILMHILLLDFDLFCLTFESDSTAVDLIIAPRSWLLDQTAALA